MQLKINDEVFDVKLENNLVKDYNYKEQFDVVCTDNTTYNELFQKIQILKNNE